MRKILFRGKWKNSGEWVYGNLFNPDKADTPTQICIGTYIARTCYEIDPKTVGQFTGLYDRNGVKIFEGDILKGCYDEDNPEEYAVLVVFWDNGWRMHQNAAEPDFLEEFDCRICEVIGNIHDNPELLEGGEENG